MMKKYKIKIILLTAAIIVLFSSCQQSDSIIVNCNYLSGFTSWDRFFASYETYVVSEESWIDAVYIHNGKKEDAQIYFDGNEVLLVKYGKTLLFDPFVDGNANSKVLDYFSDFNSRKVSIIFGKNDEKEVMLDDNQKNELYNIMLELSQVENKPETFAEIKGSKDYPGSIRVYINDDIYTNPGYFIVDSSGNYFIAFDGAVTELNDEWISFINSNTEVKIPVNLIVPEEDDRNLIW